MKGEREKKNNHMLNIIALFQGNTTSIGNYIVQTKMYCKIISHFFLNKTKNRTCQMWIKVLYLIFNSKSFCICVISCLHAWMNVNWSMSVSLLNVVLVYDSLCMHAWAHVDVSACVRELSSHLALCPNTQTKVSSRRKKNVQLESIRPVQTRLFIFLLHTQPDSSSTGLCHQMLTFKNVRFKNGSKENSLPNFLLAFFWVFLDYTAAIFLSKTTRL